MSIILSGTDGLSDVDGSASTPAIRGTDTNTGIFFPAADTIAFAEGGVESMRLDSNGNVGIGTSSPGAKLVTVGAAQVRAGDFPTTGNGLELTFTAGNAAYIQGYDRGASAWRDVVVGGNTLQFSTGGTERMRITSGGDLQFNSGYGSVATAYGCRAWVNFNGTGTVSIRASGNVSSITDMGTGTYQVNYSSSLSSNMCPVALCSDDGVSNRAINLQSTNSNYNLTTSCVVTIWQSGGGSADSTGVYVAVFR